MSEWKQVDNLPVYDATRDPRPCARGVSSHDWEMIIDEGQIHFTCECEECSEFVSELEGWELFGGSFKVTINFVRDCPVFGKPKGTSHFDGAQTHPHCDCNYWWEVQPAEEANK